MNLINMPAEIWLALLFVGAVMIHMCVRVLGTELDWALRLHKLKVDAHLLKQQQCEQILMQRKIQEAESARQKEKKQGRVNAGQKARLAAEDAAREAAAAAEAAKAAAQAEGDFPSTPASAPDGVEMGEAVEAPAKAAA